MSERTYRTLGGQCKAGHLLTLETAYIVSYDAQYRHRKRPPGPRVRCVACHQEATRTRLNPVRNSITKNATAMMPPMIPVSARTCK